ncbi:PAC2 family protein [Knoellia sp. p5-6-4]|uniref:PAC2 family protein n=1 Tax=unclassified Knoellia TaxID=2618719 RepID=UPI0023DBDECC|nr:PAC2 family protein [Knoellia sp. p5-6-4]MDF2143773.1 PAC2 family protein [Knoellia sp. p5-6-4]
MQNPSELYRFETDAKPHELRASVMIVTLGGFVDAGQTQRLLTEHLLASSDGSVVASFDVDQLLDYRGRRPGMVFDTNRWVSYDDPALALHRLVDRDGTPFLLLAGPEPDYQWERVVEAIRELVVRLGVDLVVTAHGIPMAVPHTRPIGMTAHATDPRLVPEQLNPFGRVQVPGSLSSLLELRLGESGHDAIGFAIHVPHYLAQSEFADGAVTALNAITGATALDLPIDDLVAAAGLNRAEIADELAGSEEVAQVVAALERQYDTFVEGLQKPSLLATDVSELPSADEIGAEFEQFLREVAEDERDD